MDNVTRGAVYLRDRSDLTPAQRRRYDKRENQTQAVIKRSVMRRARRDVIRDAAKTRSAIRALFKRVSR
jgi:hypothetical protein